MIKIILIVSLLICLCFGVNCPIYLTAPFGVLDLTITTRVLVDGTCDLVLSDGTLNYDTLTFTSNEIVYVDKVDEYSHYINDVDVGKDERYCAIDDLNGRTDGVCVGQATGTKTYPILRESYKIKDTLLNSYNPIYLNNVSIVITKDTSYQFETRMTKLNRFQSNKQTADLTVGSTYSMNNNILNPTFRINSPVNQGLLLRFNDGSKRVYYNYQFLDGLFEDCALGYFDLSKMGVDYYADCSSCALKYTNRRINDKILFDIQRCLDLKNSNITYISNVMSLDLFLDFTLLGVQPPFATLYEAIRTPLPKLTLQLTQNGGQCVIEPIDISDTTKTLTCDMVLSNPTEH